MDTVLVFYLCCYNKLPQTQWLKRMHIYYFTVSQDGRSMFLVDVPGENISQPFPSVRGCTLWYLAPSSILQYLISLPFYFSCFALRLLLPLSHFLPGLLPLSCLSLTFMRTHNLENLG